MDDIEKDVHFSMIDSDVVAMGHVVSILDIIIQLLNKSVGYYTDKDRQDLTMACKSLAALDMYVAPVLKAHFDRNEPKSDI